MLAIAAVGAAIVSWFVVAGALFFNKPVDRLYRAQESHPAVKSLPQGPQTIVKILVAITIQVVLWAGVYRLVMDALPEGLWARGLLFGGVIVAMKILPRDIDRVLLTTYPSRRLWIELVIGIVCAFAVSFSFAALI